MNANLPAARSDAVTQIETFHPASIFEVERFVQIKQVADVMAQSSMIPAHLKGNSIEEAQGNCFLVCSIAASLDFDPFLVAQASAVVFGKLVLEGKLVRAAIRRHLGFDLQYRFFGDARDDNRGVYVSDVPFVDDGGTSIGDDAIEQMLQDGARRITKGTFLRWRTLNKSGGTNDNWVKDERKMFRERGAREWCREFEPRLMLGVYTPDEFDDVDNTARSNRARDISPGSNPLVSESRAEKVDPDTGEITSIFMNTKSSPDAPLSSETRTSAQPPLPHDGADAAGGEATSQNAHRLSAEEFKAYYSALARMNSIDGAKKAEVNHFETHAKPVHPDDKALCVDIRKAVGDVIEKKVPPEYVVKELDGWIAAVVGGA